MSSPYGGPPPYDPDPPDIGPSRSPAAAGKSVYRTVSDVVLTGVAVIVPIVVTVYVLHLALGFLNRALQPIVELLRMAGILEFLRRIGLVGFLLDVGLYENVGGILSELIAVVALVAIVLLVGSVAYHPRGERMVNFFDVLIASIPGVGTVYRSFRRMGDIMIDDDIDNFQEVKLVDLHGADTYVIGFEVGDSPPVIGEALDDGGVATMFVPFAPNPVTGGFLTYVPRDRLVDVDMTVEEGVRNVITSGVAGQESEEARSRVSAGGARAQSAGGSSSPASSGSDADDGQSVRGD